MLGRQKTREARLGVTASGARGGVAWRATAPINSATIADELTSTTMTSSIEQSSFFQQRIAKGEAVVKGS